MKQIILRNIVLVITLLIMVVLTILSTIPAHGAATARPTPSSQGRGATPATTLAATEIASTRVPRIVFVATRNGTPDLYTMDPDGKNIVQLTNDRGFKLFPTWSPDGRLIAYLAAVGVGKAPLLMVVNADGSKPHQINIGKAVAISPPAWSPDSKQIAYISVRSNTGDSGLYIFDLATAHEQKLHTAMSIDFSYSQPTYDVALTDAFAPSWSPDGNFLLVYGGLGKNPDTTLLVTHDGKTVKPFFDFLTDFNYMLMNPDCAVPNDPCVGTSAIWSPDGSQVFFAAIKPSDPNQGISWNIADSQGVVHTVLFIDKRVFALYPSWSPDAKKIVFAGINYATKKWHIYVMSPDGSNNTQLTDDSFSEGEGWPSWGMVPVELVKR